MRIQRCFPKGPKMVNSYKPSKAQILSARDKTVPDVIAPGLRVLFCGINPGLYSAAIGHHFGRPGNRFWRVLHEAGFTERLLSPFEDSELPHRGYGITNLVQRATATAAELHPGELVEGARRLEATVQHYQPAIVAMLGVGAYRKAYGRLAAKVGAQQEGIGEAQLWVLPNPSGLNAHYQLPDLVALFRELREASEENRREEG